jgi:class 3 adenylate cyclase
VKRPLLLTEGTAQLLKDRSNLEGFPPQEVRGVEEPMLVYTVTGTP